MAKVGETWDVNAFWPDGPLCPACGRDRAGNAWGCRYHACEYRETVSKVGRPITVMGPVDSGCECETCKAEGPYIWTLQGDWYTKDLRYVLSLPVRDSKGNLVGFTHKVAKEDGTYE